MAEKKKRFLVFDANSLIHRAYHALPPLSTPKGEMVNAVYGFFLVFFKVTKEFQPDYVAAAFDAPGPTERHKKFKEYKAGREEAPDELYAQIPLIKEALEKLGVPMYEEEGYEADDFVGTISKLAEKKQAYPPVETIIVSGDQDTFQLISSKTKVYTMRKGVQDTVLYDEKAIEKKFEGLKPEQMIDYKALRGDPSDNIPGVTGIGEKTAIQLLNEFGSLDNLYKKLESKKGAESIKPRIAQLLLDYKDQAELSRDLVTINRSIPVPFRFEDLKWKGGDPEIVREALERFGFRSFLKKMEEEKAPKRAKKQLQLTPTDSSREDDSKEAIEKIERFHQDNVFSGEIYELERNLVPVMRDMEEAGIKIDTRYFAKLEKEVGQEIEKLEKDIHGISKKPFNINSPQQLSDILFDVLSLSAKGLKKTPGGAISTAAEELEKLKEEHPIIQKIITYKELQKLFTTYIKPLPELADERDRLHTHFDQLGAATGRISSSNPNLQNIPMQGEWGKKIRRGFIADKGNILAAFDYSQMELRIAAYIAKDEKMEEFFQKGADIHRMTAAEVFGIDPSKVAPEMRYRAKALNFGILYGMGARGFSRSAGVTFDEAIDFIDQYFVRFPGIHTYIEETKEFAREHGYTETLFGRKRYIPEINSNNPQLRAGAERIAVNHPIQGSAADIVKMAMVDITQSVLRNAGDINLLLQIHDELLFEGKKEVIKKLAPKITASMETAWKVPTPLKVEMKTGTSWGELSPVL